MIIWYIHGAGASDRSFAWLHAQLSEFPARFVNYQPAEPVEAVSRRVVEMIVSDGRPAMLVGHSLGGIIAAGCARISNVDRVVTVCAPFGGIKHADFLALFNSHPLLHDLRPYGPTLTALRTGGVDKPHLAIVGTRGLPFLREHNDGVLSVASQMALASAQYQPVPYNHFEVLLSDEVVELIRDFARSGA